MPELQETTANSGLPPEVLEKLSEFEPAPMPEPELLHPELLSCIEGEGFVRHPLVFAHFVDPETESAHNAFANRQLQWKLDCIERYKRESDWMGVVMAHERPYRCMAVFKHWHEMDDKSYWECVREAWKDSENIWQWEAYWRFLLLGTTKKGSFMTPTEQAFVAALPKRVRVYRGYKAGLNRRGMSWTLSNEKAEWFANRYKELFGEGTVAERTVSKNKIYAYTNDRKEEEIIIL